MAKKRKLRQELSKFAHKTEKPLELISGALGIYIGGKQYVDIPTRAGYVFVRLRNNMSELIQAHNQTVSPIYDLPVLVVWNHNRYEIYGRDSEQYGSYWDTSSSFLPKHGFQHEFDPDNNGGGDLVFVHGEQFYPMMTFPSGTDGANTVLIAPYRYFYQGLWRYTGNTGVGDLLALGPTGGNSAKLLLVGITSATGNPFIKQGDEFSEGITGAAALTQFVPTSLTPIDEIPGGIIRLVTGTETITWANIYDARQYMGILQAGSGTAGASTFLELSDTPNSYAGQADKLLVVNAAETAVEFRTNTGTSGGSHILTVVDDIGGLASGDNDDYTPTGYDANTDVIIIYGNSDNTSRITGITGGTNGRKLTIINNSEFLVNFAHQGGGGGSSAGNTMEFNTSDGMSIRANESLSLVWYTSLGEWVVVDERKERDTFWLPGSMTGTVTANQFNWSLSKFNEKAVFLVSPTADRDIAGISSAIATTIGQILIFVNTSPTYTLTFRDSSGTSYNQISMGGDVAVRPGKSITIWYDPYAQKWRNIATTAFPTGTASSPTTGTPYSFLDLTDTPDSYSGQGSKYVAVNSGATALEFVSVSPSGGGGSGVVIYDDSIYQVTGSAISFDSNLSVTVTGSTAFVSSTGGGISIAGNGLEISGSSIGYKDIGVKLSNSAAFSVTGNASIALPFDTELYDTDNMHSLTGTGLNTRITINTSGKYILVGGAEWATNATGGREIWIQKNGNIFLSVNAALGSSGISNSVRCIVATIDNSVAGDYFQLMAFQNSGGALNISTGTAGPGPYSPTFSAQRIG